jgi:CheY-like chemotaxis protein
MGSKKGPIIILEDDADEQELLAEVFTKMQVSNEVKFFTDGESFLKYLRSTPDQPFIIISDVNIPMLNGLEVKAIINRDDFLRKKSIPFVFLSTSAEKKAVEEAYDLTAQGYFLKQNTINEIERHLRLILDYWSECKHTNSV